MNIINSNEDIERFLDLGKESFFLAGPTPRSKDILSWRPEALDILRTRQYNGQVLVPEHSNIGIPDEYIDQVEWEHYGLEHCSRIIFWIPRKISTMPAFTTNVEFGHYVNSGRVIYGRPDDAEKCRYLDWIYKKYNWRPIYNDLKTMLNSI